MHSQLPSGRTVLIQTDAKGEMIEVRSVDGVTELRIVLTEQGPVLSLRGVRLQIDSSDTVAVRCRHFEVQASESVRLNAAGSVGIHSQADIQLKSKGNTDIDGELVKLNCGDRTGYPDDPAQLPPVGLLPQQPGTSGQGTAQQPRSEADPGTPGNPAPAPAPGGLDPAGADLRSAGHGKSGEGCCR